MLLFATVLDPLICLLERHLSSIRIGHLTKETAVLAYADDVKIFVMSPANIKIIGISYKLTEGKRCAFEHSKLKAMAAGLWDKSMKILITQCNQEMIVLASDSRVQ